MSVLWGDLPWDEIKEKINDNLVAILVCGAVEQHALHLPVAIDTYFSFEVAKRAAELVSQEIDVLVLPPLFFGRSEEESNYPGTIWLQPDTYLKLIEDICDSMIHYGVKRIILYSGHGNNPPLLNEVCKVMRTRHDDVFIGALPPVELVRNFINEGVESKFWGHACEMETSFAYEICPELVKKEKIKRPDVDIYKIIDRNSVEGSLYISWRVEDFSDTGAFGDPTKASAEKGKLWVDELTKRFAEVIVDFSKFDRRDTKKLEI